jgi:hypothetical protein
MEKQITHHETCWLDGKDHYMCALWKISQLSIDLAIASTLMTDYREQERYKNKALDIQNAMLMTNYREK